MTKFTKFIIPLFALALLLVSCKANPSTTGSASSSAPAVTQPNNESLDKARRAFDGRMLTGKHIVVLHVKNQGDISIELDADAAPKTVTNFIQLAKNGYYDNLIFHRVIPDFMIQGGDPDGNGSGGESIFGASFADDINAKSYGLDKKKVKDVSNGEDLPPEVLDMTIAQAYEQQGYKYNDKLQSLPITRGAIAMANRGPDTNGSQFFIVQGTQDFGLAGKYTVFGKVTSGMETVDAIAKVNRDQNDKPLANVVMTVEVKS